MEEAFRIDMEDHPGIAAQQKEQRLYRLFRVIGLNDKPIIEDYIVCLIQQKIYSVRLLLCRLRGLVSSAEMTSSLVKMKIRTIHALQLVEIFFGEYHDVEMQLIQQGVLHMPDLLSSWKELLFSLDIEPAQEIGEQVQHATGAGLQELLQLFHQIPTMKENILHDILHRVPVFQEIPYLIEVLGAALPRGFDVLPPEARHPPAPSVSFSYLFSSYL